MSEPMYVVTGKNGKGEQVFYDIDSGSGYPYASSFTYRRTVDVLEAVAWLDECTPDSRYSPMYDAVVAKIAFEPVDVIKIVAERTDLQRMIEGLTPTQLKMLKVLAK